MLLRSWVYSEQHRKVFVLWNLHPGRRAEEKTMNKKESKDQDNSDVDDCIEGRKMR